MVERSVGAPQRARRCGHFGADKVREQGAAGGSGGCVIPRQIWAWALARQKRLIRCMPPLISRGGSGRSFSFSPSRVWNINSTEGLSRDRRRGGHTCPPQASPDSDGPSFKAFALLSRSGVSPGSPTATESALCQVIPLATESAAQVSRQKPNQHKALVSRPQLNPPNSRPPYMPHSTLCCVLPLRLRLISGLASNLTLATTPSDAGCPDGCFAKRRN